MMGISWEYNFEGPHLPLALLSFEEILNSQCLMFLSLYFKRVKYHNIVQYLCSLLYKLPSILIPCCILICPNGIVGPKDDLLHYSFLFQYIRSATVTNSFHTALFIFYFLCFGSHLVYMCCSVSFCMASV